MKDLIQCDISRDDFQRWLDWGKTPMTIWQGEKAVTVLTRLEKSSSVDYLYRTAVERDGNISWDNSLVFCGAYSRQSKALYLTKDSLSCVTVGTFPFASETDPSIVGEFCSRINRCVEGIIANDRERLTVKELSDWEARLRLSSYQEGGAKMDAIQCVFDGREPDTQFHSGYTLDELPEAAFISWLQSPEDFFQAEAERYIEEHQEDYLLQFLKNDALQEEYQAIMRDAGSPIHRMKAITDAVIRSGAKSVTVTVQKGGQELAFKTDADSLIGYRNFYSTLRIPAPDRRKFEQMFGRNADYGAGDITKITYGRNTIYEAPPVQAQDMAGENNPSIGMGGISL